ncbi:hypothetical protein SCLCIDRAFT_1209764 [Scleroderma citrinum Foug A]|uniref:Uncharacterized protein n=1 Tax=Scleroderma citrinum Foug A TaxID=1036808 RepID=A0A0C3ARV5_9AGAM|nr:hypothetical protein SCLCIDRAFT_1209764 [Scleroderma citrinum Foug A]
MGDYRSSLANDDKGYILMWLLQSRRQGLDNTQLLYRHENNGDTFILDEPQTKTPGAGTLMMA